jgi:hypothetical protein
VTKQKPETINLKEERFILAHGFRFHCFGPKVRQNIMGARGGCSAHGSQGAQEERKRSQGQKIYSSKISPRDLCPPTRPIQL